MESKKKIKFEANNMYVISDFDRTMTTSESSDSWDAAGCSLGKGFLMESTMLYEKYRPIELDYKISYEKKYEAMEIWYKECMDLYYKYGLTLSQLEKQVKESGLIFRNGVKKFLKEMNEKNIPVIIISAGIGNVIEIFLKENECYYPNMYIISNFLGFDNEGRIEKYNKQLIHTMNKTANGNLPKELQEEIKKRKYKLLFGDTIEDKQMVDECEHENTLLVGFLNENVEENFELYKKEFDICLVGNAKFPKIEIN